MAAIRAGERPENAEDVVQETLLAIVRVRARPVFSHDGELHSYFQRAAVRRVRRTKGRRKPSSLPDDFDLEEDSPGGDLDDLREIVTKMLDHLEPQQKLVVHARAVLALSWEEVAKRVREEAGTEMTVSAIKSLYHRAIKELRRRFGGQS
jgi:RNA polymerase sigma factor (sigma-70 family)